MITIEGLSLRYPGSDHPALDSLNLSVTPGRVFGLLGPNGAGKSSLFSILTGLRSADSGRVSIAGFDSVRERRHITPLIGYVPQALAFYPTLTVAENLRLFGRLTQSSDQRLRFATETAQLEPHDRKRGSQLSGGLQRRLNLAIGLLGEPRLLLLDEPTVGVDPQSRRFILDTIRRLCDQGLTVVYASHYMDEVERLCDDIAIVDHGRVLAQGTLDELLAAGDADLEALFLRLTDRRLRDAA